MTRIALLALMIPAAAPAVAADALSLNCTATAAIVADAVAARADGKDKAATTEAVKADGLDSKYIPAVPPLVDWVFTLPQDQLTDEAAAAYRKACLAQGT